MSSFNMVAGTNKLAGFVLHALNLEHTQVPRFRDAYVDLDDPLRPQLVILTRTGGGNRADFASENLTLSGMPGFIEDHDDAFDSTFAHWKFDIPPDPPAEVTRLLDKLRYMAADPNSDLDPEILMKPMDRFRSRLDSGGWDPTPMAKKLGEALRNAGFGPGK
jgi:hypothetical protein